MSNLKILDDLTTSLVQLVQSNPAFDDVEICSNSVVDIARRYSVKGPICHVGSKLNGAEPGAAARLRSAFSFVENPAFVGIDIAPGENVDCVSDITAIDFFNKHPALYRRFGFVYCSALLEHVRQPFDAAKSISLLLKSKGHLWYSGPWVWGYHAYPDDYWRISISGLRVLFPELEWKDWWYTSTNDRIGLRIKKQTPRNERKLFVAFEQSSSLSKLLTDRRMPYLCISAIGQMRS
jgi:hypothetical protein